MLKDWKKPNKGQWRRKATQRDVLQRRKQWEEMKPIINPYDGIVIPGIVLMEPEISWHDKILYGIICSLSVERGYCLAGRNQVGSTKNLSLMLNETTSSINNSLLRLKTLRLIIVGRFKKVRRIRPRWVATLSRFEIDYILQNHAQLEPLKEPYKGIHIPEIIYTKTSISTDSKIMYGILFEKCRNKSFCIIKLGTMAFHMHTTKAKIRSMIKELTDKNLITFTTKKYKASTGKYLNKYKIKLVHSYIDEEDIKKIKEQQKKERILRAT